MFSDISTAFFVVLIISFQMCAILSESGSIFRSRDRVVGIATSYELDDRGVGVQVPIE
jgi:hypothetical protein